MQHSNQPHNSDKNQRSGGERRRLQRQHAFPFIDTHGYLVIEERRGISPERRIRQK